MSHNDLFTSNILYTFNREIKLIDLEYCSPNRLWADLINFFVESCIDYKNP